MAFRRSTRLCPFAVSARRAWGVICLQIALTVPAAAQEASTYRQPAEPLYWVSDNPFRLFLIQEGDTIPGSVRGMTVFRSTWDPVAGGFDLIRESVHLGLNTTRRSDTMMVTPRGRVVAINGSTDDSDGEWDALLRLPSAPLHVGYAWSDTISHSTQGPHGEGVYAARRRYRVDREIDSAGITGLEVVIEGDIDFRLSMWMDSAAGLYRWFDLSGPVQERFVFDPEEGQLVLRTWSMLLEGVGGDHDGERSDTVAAGLRSANRRYRIPKSRAELLMTPLPGTDSSISLRDDGAPIFMHTHGRDAEKLVAGFKRQDGKVGSAEVRLTDGRPTRWAFTWVEPTSDPSQSVLKLDNGATAPRRPAAPATYRGVGHCRIRHDGNPDSIVGSSWRGSREGLLRLSSNSRAVEPNDRLEPRLRGLSARCSRSGRLRDANRPGPGPARLAAV